MAARSRPAREVATSAAFHSWPRIERALERLDERIALEEWGRYMGRSRRGPEPYQIERSRFLRNLSPSVGAASPSRDRPDGDGRRRRELLKRLTADAAAEQDPGVVRLRGRLMRSIVGFRPRWGRRRVGRAVVRAVLQSERNRALRRRAFHAEDPLLESVETPLRELTNRRNERARDLGFRSFPELVFSYEGLTVGQVRTWAEETLSGTRPWLRRLRADFEARTKESDWYPWDFVYAIESRANLPEESFSGSTMPDRVRSALREWGVPPSALRVRVDRHDIPAGGFAFSPRIPNDVRILVHPRGGWLYYLVLFHEFGHAIHSRSIRQPSQLLRGGAPGFAAFHEGIADVFEEIPNSREWLGRQPGLDPQEVERFVAGGPLERANRAARMAVEFLVELAMYERPSADLRVLKHRLDRAWFGFDEFPPTPAIDSFFVFAPMYLQNYLLSSLFRAQVVEAMPRSRSGAVWPNRFAGPWLTDQFLRHGAKIDWIPLLRAATGRRLSVRPFLDRLAAG